MCKEMSNTPQNLLNGAEGCMNTEEQNPTHYRRVLLVGDTGCGKTTLIKTLCTDGKQIGVDETCGIGIHLLQVSKDKDNNTPVEDLENKLEDSDADLCLEFWDIANKKIWHRCQSLFIHQKGVCVIVFNLTDQSTIQSVSKYWMSIIAKAPLCPIVVIGTHADNVNEEQQNKACLEVLTDCKNRLKQRNEQLQNELDVLKNFPGKKSPTIEDKIQHLEWTLEHIQPPSNILTSSCEKQGDVAKIKKSILKAVLRTQNDVENQTKEALSTMCQQITSLRKENHLVVSKDNICKKRSTSASKKKRHSKVAKHEDVCLSYLHDTGAILEVNTCSRNHSSSLQNIKAPSSNNSTTTKDSLVCINSAVLLHTILAIHVDNTKAAFKFEANRFWPKSEGVTKPNPSLLVQALEEIATQGLVRECLFPLLWQSLTLSEDQTMHVIDFLCSEGILVRELQPVSSEPDYRCLTLPHFSHLSTQLQYRLPLLQLLKEQGPSLNWTPKPFEGDIQLSWRYDFLGVDLPGGMNSRLLAYCYNHCPNQAVYQHYWRNGLLMKMGQVYIHISTDDASSHIVLTGRITTDEEGDDKATEMIWIALSHFLLCVQQYLKHWPGLEYKVFLLPSTVHYTSSTLTPVDSLAVPFLQCFHTSSKGETTLDIQTSDDVECKVKLNSLLPLTGNFDMSLEDWLTWLSEQPLPQSDHIPTPDITHVQDLATEGSETSNTTSPEVPQNKENGVQFASPPSKDKVHAKKKEIKWNLGPQITEEQQIKEAKKVAATFVATILAGAMAQYISLEMTGPSAEAAATASAQAAKAVQTGDPEAAARAVIAAAQAVNSSSSSSGNSGVSRFTRSRLCSIV